MEKVLNIINVLIKGESIFISKGSSRNYDLIIIKLGMILHHKKINNNFLILERRSPNSKQHISRFSDVCRMDGVGGGRLLREFS